MQSCIVGIGARGWRFVVGTEAALLICICVEYLGERI